MLTAGDLNIFSPINAARAKLYQPSLTTQDHSQGTICRRPRISYQRLVLRTLVGLNLRTGRMWP